MGNRQEVIERVLRHQADVAVSGKPPGDDRLIAEPLGENAIALISAPGDPAAAGEPIEAAALAGRAWLLREPGSGTRALNEQFLAERGLQPTVLELGSNGAIKQAARAGLGVSLLSRAAVEAELEAGRLSEISLSDGPRDAAVVRAAIRGRARPADSRRVSRLHARDSRAPLAPSDTAARAVTT